MTPWSAAAPMLLALGILAWPAPAAVHRPAERRRVRTTAAWLTPRRRTALVASAGAAGASLLLDMPSWVAVGAVVGAGAVAWQVAGRRAAAVPSDPAAAAVLCDLLAACLDSGLPMAQGIDAVLTVRRVEWGVGPEPLVGVRTPARPGGADVVGGHGSSGAAARLADVAALLALGASPESAWRPVEGHPDLAPLAAAARRSALGGVRMAEAVRDVAVELRAGARARAERSAARAGVAMTAPLALCFLPAFILLGLAPVVIGLIGTLHIL